MIYLMICLCGPDAFSEDVRAVLFRTLFAFAWGPLGSSVVLTQNSFVPQSMDQTSLLLIHLQPLVTAHTLKYHGDSSAFPYSADIDLWRYCIPPFIFVGVHMVFHTIFFLVFALHMPPNHETAFNDLMTSENIYTTILGMVGSGGPRILGSEETLRFLAFEVVSTLGIFGLVVATYPLYIADSDRIGLGIIIGIFLFAIAQGAQWTEYRVGRITSEIDELISMEEASLRPKGNDTYEDYHSPAPATVGHAASDESTVRKTSSEEQMKESLNQTYWAQGHADDPKPTISDGQISQEGFTSDDGADNMTTPFRA